MTAPDKPFHFAQVKITEPDFVALLETLHGQGFEFRAMNDAIVLMERKEEPFS